VAEPGIENVKQKDRTVTRKVKFCPRCGSAEISFASGLAYLWSIWECRNCGYYGAFIVEDGKLSQKLQEEYAKKGQRISVR
jgi:predicted RNA-binding Zn-ribbon protein involved in translation (DUF1610 family)